MIQYTTNVFEWNILVRKSDKMSCKNYDKKYANLLVKKCFVNDGIRPLVILYDDELEKFAQTCYIQAKECGFKDVVLFNKKSREINEYLLNNSLDDIKINDLLDRSLLEDYAKKNSNFLFLETYKKETNINIDKEKKQKLNEIIDSQLDTYYENIDNLKCPWCVACYPNYDWAKKVYPNMNIEDAYERLYLNIMKMCQIDKRSPEKAWDEIHKRYYEISQRLNELEIKKLHYSNKLGTNLNIYLPDNHLWIGADDRDYYGNSIIVNMPGYELFTSPLCSETNGIVYSSKPLYYKKVIDSFGLEFKNGSVSNIITSVKEDYDILKSIIDRDDNSKYLGECAIVENDNPVNKTNTLYYELLYDENASCHLALGNSYPDSIKNGLSMTEEELISSGLNISNTHVDFMIGTDDLKIEAETKNGPKLIYSKGKFRI